MAGGQERILRGRIASMQATKKITRAMELIAASRIVKAQQRVHAAVPYSEQITEVVNDLAAAGGSTSTRRCSPGASEIRTTCYVVITADRGLCGGYNAGVQRAAEGEIKADVLAGKDYAIIPVGRKAEAYFRFRGYHLGQAFAGFSDNPTYDDAKAHRPARRRAVSPAARSIASSSSTPASSRRQPGSRAAAAGAADGRDRRRRRRQGRPADGPAGDYEFEPDPTTILDTLLPRYVEARVYAALLNAAASEHAFRQRAMKSATDNAEELIKNLSRHHEPRPAGLDHHRDHGDRQRRRSARLRQATAVVFPELDDSPSTPPTSGDQIETAPAVNRDDITHMTMTESDRSKAGSSGSPAR